MVKKTAAPETPNKLQEALEAIEKKFGTGSIMRMGDDRVRTVEVISSGIPALDDALGIGGFPRGRIVEIYGPESSGKSTVALHLVSEAQSKGLTCAYIDVEYGLDPKYMRALGVDVDNLLLSQPDTAEEALEISNTLAKTGEVAVIVIDSVNSLVPRSQFEGEIGDANIGRRAKLMSDGLSLIVSSAARTGTILFFINQLREKMNVMYGSPETTTGGRALRFYASVRLDIRKRDAIKDGNEIIGHETEIKVVKNKMAAAYKSARFDLILGQGVPEANSLFDVAVNLGIINKAGAWFSYAGEQLGQGRPKSLEFLREHQDTYECIREDVTKALTSKEDE